MNNSNNATQEIIRRKIKMLNLLVDKGHIFTEPIETNELLRSVCNKNDSLLNSEISDAYKDAVAADISDTAESMITRFKENPANRIAISETFVVDDYRVKIIIAPRGPRKDL